MNEALLVAAQATRDIEAWLRGLPQTTDVLNVENDAAYRAIDVDILWTVGEDIYQVEIKGDRWSKTGNFFFETISNEERGTPGCFLYTEADYVFYYFTETRVLYILPMPETRDWFLANRASFQERRTQTPVGDGVYTTVGCLVPISTILLAVPFARVEHL